MLSETKVALPKLSAFIDPAAAEADALDNNVEGEEGSPPDAMVLLDLILGAATAFEGSLSAPTPWNCDAIWRGGVGRGNGGTFGRSDGEASGHVLLLATDDANW
jgi:hypothetical protein